jgi:hypothetical protein
MLIGFSDSCQYLATPGVATPGVATPGVATPGVDIPLWTFYNLSGFKQVITWLYHSQVSLSTPFSSQLLLVSACALSAD